MPVYQPTPTGLFPFPSSRIVDPFTHNKVTVLDTFRVVNSTDSLPDPADYSLYDIIRLDSGTLYQRNAAVEWELWPTSAYIGSPSATDPEDPIQGFMYYNTVLEYYRFWDGSQWLPLSAKYSYFQGINTELADIVIDKFIPGYTELYVFGKQGWWIPKVEGLTLYMFEEVQDGGGDYTIVRPHETLGHGPYIVKYIKDL